MNTRKLMGASALALFMTAGLALAKVEVGVDAPDVTGGEFINIEPLKMSDLKGRVVFLELFSTT